MGPVVRRRSFHCPSQAPFLTQQKPAHPPAWRSGTPTKSLSSRRRKYVSCTAAKATAAVIRRASVSPRKHGRRPKPGPEKRTIAMKMLPTTSSAAARRGKTTGAPDALPGTTGHGRSGNAPAYDLHEAYLARGLVFLYAYKYSACDFEFYSEACKWRDGAGTGRPSARASSSQAATASLTESSASSAVSLSDMQAREVRHERDETTAFTLQQRFDDDRVLKILPRVRSVPVLRTGPTRGCRRPCPVAGSARQDITLVGLPLRGIVPETDGSGRGLAAARAHGTRVR